MAISEQEIMLVCAVQNKDKNSFEELYKKYYKKIYAIAFATTKNVPDAEDILQITFSKAWQSISSLEDPSAFNTWLQKIAINESNNLLNKRKPSVSIDDEEDESPVAELESDLMLPEVYAEKEDLSARLRLIIYELSDVQKQTIMLFYFDNLTISEIAQVMDCNESTVKSRLFLARKAIRTEIEEQERKTGTKFFGIAGIPVLPFARIFVEQVEQSLLSESTAAVIFEKINSTVLSASSTAASASTASETAKAVGAAAAKKGISAAAKAIIGIISGSVIICGIAGILIGVSLSGKDDPNAAVTTATVAEATVAEATVEETTAEETTTVQTTEPPTAPEYLDAYIAYKSVLENDETSIRNYTWQLGAGNESRPVVFCDITGDDTPELIYINAYRLSPQIPDMGSTKLNIYTYEDGQAKHLYTSENLIWDENEAGACVSTFLFQIEGEKTLYAFHKGADQYATQTYYQFKEDNDSLKAEKYTDATYNLTENVSDILMMSEGMPESQGIDTNVHKNKAMTYKEAIAFLNGKTDNNVTATESDSYEKKRKVYESYSDVIKQSKENDDPNSNPELYFVYDVDKDDIPELFIILGHGMAQRYEMYTFKSGDDKAFFVNEIAAADSGPKVDKNGNLYIIGGRSGYYGGFCVKLDGYEDSYEKYNLYSDDKLEALECTDISNLTTLQNEILN